MNSSIDAAVVWKISRFTLLDRSDIHMIDSLPILDYTFARDILT